MKTITEYRPLIFGELFAQSEKRRSQPRRIGWSGAAVASYCILGLWLSLDTGFAPWNWQFWMVIGPLFVAGELAARELSMRRRVRKAVASF
jgi:hypothetical protein